MSSSRGRWNIEQVRGVLRGGGEKRISSLLIDRPHFSNVAGQMTLIDEVRPYHLLDCRCMARHDCAGCRKSVDHSFRSDDIPQAKRRREKLTERPQVNDVAGRF